MALFQEYGEGDRPDGDKNRACREGTELPAIAESMQVADHSQSLGYGQSSLPEKFARLLPSTNMIPVGQECARKYGPKFSCPPDST